MEKDLPGVGGATRGYKTIHDDSVKRLPCFEGMLESSFPQSCPNGCFRVKLVPQAQKTLQIHGRQSTVDCSHTLAKRKCSNLNLSKQAQPKCCEVEAQIDTQPPH